MRTEDIAEELASRERQEAERRGIPQGRPSARRTRAVQRQLGELAVLAAEYLFRRDRYREKDYSNKRLDAMSFAEDRLREHPLVAKQLSFYQEKGK